MVVWSLASLVRELRPGPATLASQEAVALRDELAYTREALEEIRSGQDHCKWRVWALGWSLKISVVLDFFLVLFVVWVYFKRPRPNPVAIPPNLAIGDTGGSSESESTSPVNPKHNLEGPASGSPSPKIRGRPTRPSDLRNRQ